MNAEKADKEKIENSLLKAYSFEFLRASSKRSRMDRQFQKIIKKDVILYSSFNLKQPYESYLRKINFPLELFHESE